MSCVPIFQTGQEEKDRRQMSKKDHPVQKEESNCPSVSEQSDELSKYCSLEYSLMQSRTKKLGRHLREAMQKRHRVNCWLKVKKLKNIKSKCHPKKLYQETCLRKEQGVPQVSVSPTALRLRSCGDTAVFRQEPMCSSTIPIETHPRMPCGSSLPVGRVLNYSNLHVVSPKSFHQVMVPLSHLDPLPQVAKFTDCKDQGHDWSPVDHQGAVAWGDHKSLWLQSPEEQIVLPTKEFQPQPAMASSIENIDQHSFVGLSTVLNTAQKSSGSLLIAREPLKNVSQCPSQVNDRDECPRKIPNVWPVSQLGGGKFESVHKMIRGLDVYMTATTPKFDSPGKSSSYGVICPPPPWHMQKKSGVFGVPMHMRLYDDLSRIVFHQVGKTPSFLLVSHLTHIRDRPNSIVRLATDRNIEGNEENSVMMRGLVILGKGGQKYEIWMDSAHDKHQWMQGFQTLLKSNPSFMKALIVGQRTGHGKLC